ncbi:hypothetical protein FYP69_08925 [Salmonella enterica]|nr:hypothetical protein [Salmonella enterica]TLC82091.1 hypothetical protein E2F12_15340 [Salmonella enterica subsp. enterica serovar Enteritidis]
MPFCTKRCCESKIRNSQKMPDAGCRMPDAGCRMPDAGCRMPDAGCRMPDAGCRMPDAGCRLRLLRPTLLVNFLLSRIRKL